jgi:hypothetical protein
MYTNKIASRTTGKYNERCVSHIQERVEKKKKKESSGGINFCT